YVNEVVPGMGSTGWTSLGTSYAKSIAVTTAQNGLPAIFAITYDNSVEVNEQNSNGSWTGWTSLRYGGAIFKALVATQSNSYTPEVFGIGFDNAAYTLTQNTDTSWGGWNYLGGGLKQISATQAYGVTSLFGLGMDNGLYVNQYSTYWSGWYNIGSGG